MKRRQLDLFLAESEGEHAITTDDEYTPPELLDLIRDFYGGDIDLDPCSAPRAFVGARVQYGIADDGLSQPWSGIGGRIETAFGAVAFPGFEIRNRYVNPPYSKPRPWIEKICALHRDDDVGNTIALVKCDTSTRWWQPIWLADAILFFSRRIAFVSPLRKERVVAKFPCAMPYWGPHAEAFADFFAELGHVYRPLAEAEAIVQGLADRGLVRRDGDRVVSTLRGIAATSEGDPSLRCPCCGAVSHASTIVPARVCDACGCVFRRRDAPGLADLSLIAVDGVPVDAAAAEALRVAEVKTPDGWESQVSDPDADTLVEPIPVDMSPLAEHPQAYPAVKDDEGVRGFLPRTCPGCGERFWSRMGFEKHVCLPGGSR